MNWHALAQTFSLCIATAAFCNMVRLYFLDRKVNNLHKIWRDAAYMLMLNQHQASDILELCELCRVSSNEIVEDMKSINPSYWILSSRKNYNVPYIQDRFATLLKTKCSRPWNQANSQE